jgi:hypothetical protein
MPLETEIRTYDERREEFERRFNGKFVVIHGRELLGVYDDFNSANREGERLLDVAPFLIRQVGMSELQKLTDRITADNRHNELSWGKPLGREVW